MWNEHEVISGTRVQNVSERLPCPAVGRRGILRRCMGQKTTAEAVKKWLADERWDNEISRGWTSKCFPFFHLSEIMVQNIWGTSNFNACARSYWYWRASLAISCAISSRLLKDEGYIRQTSAILWKILILLLVMRAWTGSGIENMSTCFLVPIVKRLCDRNRTSSHSLSSLLCSHSYM